MTTIKISDSFEAALQELFSAQVRMANHNKDGWVKGNQNFIITTVTSSACIDDNTVGIEITSAPKVKGMLYEKTSYFMFNISDELHLVPASRLVTLVEELHSDKLFSEKPERGKLLKTKNDKIYGFVSVDDIKELSHGHFNYLPPESER
jgi:hypothetical protein